MPRKMRRYGEIRPFTAEEFAWMNGTIDSVNDVITSRRLQLLLARANPANYLLETNRDAMNRLENLVTKDMTDRDQLLATRERVITSMDTDELDKWFALAATINDSTAGRVFAEQAQYSSTAETVRHVAADTLHDLTTPSSWPWWIWAVGGVGVLWFLRPFFVSRER
jgi:hypothetical protein